MTRGVVFPNIKKKTFFLIVLTLVLTCVLFRDVFLEAGVKYVLRSLPSKEETLTYESLEWVDGKGVILGFKLEKEFSSFSADRVEVSLEFDLFHLYSQVNLTVLHPEIALKQNASSKPLFLPGFIPSRFFGLKIDAEYGVLILEHEPVQRFYFTFKSGESKGKIGSLSLGDDPRDASNPLLFIDLEAEEKTISANVELKEADCLRLVQCSAFFEPRIKEGWQTVQGIVDLKGEIHFTLPFRIHALQGDITLAQAALENPIQGFEFETEKFYTEFTYPAAKETENVPFWKKIKGSLNLQEASLKLNGWDFSALNALIVLDPQVDPLCELTTHIHRDDVTYPLQLSSKGSVHEDHTFWMEASLSLDAQKKTHAEISLCSSKPHFYVAQAELNHFETAHLKMVQDLVAISYPEMRDIQINQGTLNGKMTGWINQGKLSQVSVESLLVANGALHYSPLNIDSSFKSFACEAQTLEGKLTQLKGELGGGRLTIQQNGKNYDLNKIDGVFSIEEGLLQPSRISAEFFSIPLEVSLKEHEGNMEAQLAFSTNYSAILSATLKELKLQIPAVETNVQGSLFFKGKPGKNCVLDGKIEWQSAKKDTLEFGCDFELLSYFPWSLGKVNGWVLSESLSSAFYYPLVKIFNQEIELSGDVEVIGKFDKEKALLSLQATDFSFVHPLFEGKIDKIGEEKRALLNFDFQNNQCTGTIPLKNALIKEKRMGLVFDQLSTHVRFVNTLFFLEDIVANYDGLKVLADGQLEFSDETHAALKLVTTSLEGSVTPLSQLATACGFLPKMKTPLVGRLLSKENGFCLDALFSVTEDPKISWHFKGSLEKGYVGIKEGMCLEDLSFNVEIISSTESVNVEKILGNLLIEDTAYLLKGEEFFSDNTHSSLNLGLFDPSKELIRCVAEYKENENAETVFTFDNVHTHFFGSKLNIETCVFNKQGCKFLKMDPHLLAKSIAPSFTFLSKGGLLPLQSSFSKDINDLHLQGDILGHISFNKEEEEMVFSAESHNLKSKEISFANAHLRGKVSGSELFIERLELGDFALKAAACQGKQNIEIPQFEIEIPGMHLQGDAQLNLSNKTCKGRLQDVELDLANLRSFSSLKMLKSSAKLKGDFTLTFPHTQDVWALDANLSFALDLFAPLSLNLKNEKMVRLKGSSTQGLSLEGVDMRTSASEGRCVIKKVDYDFASKQWKMQQARLTIPQDLMKLLGEAQVIPPAFMHLQFAIPLEATFEAELGPKICQINGTIKDGKYGIGSFALPLKQIALKYDPKSFSLRCKTVLNDKSLFTHMQLDFTQETLGMVKIQEDPQLDGVKILFKTDPKKGMEIHSIEGKLKGLDIQVKKGTVRGYDSNQALTGKITLDGEKVAKLLPKDLQEKIKELQIGAGYSVEGTFTLKNTLYDPFYFSGKIKGEQFSLLGLQLQGFEGEVEASSKRVYLSAIHLSDKAGKAHIKEVKFTQEEEGWNVEIPLLQVQEFTPSLLTEIGAQPKPKKPFFVRNLSLYNITGKLSDSSSLKGSGELVFTNQDKKEPHFLDLPLDMIKSWGIDLGLLTPIQGEIELDLMGDKFYLSNLKNMFSEGKRSEFYLANEANDSYVDMKGNMHIDLRMRQDVALKITEPLVLKVRGTLKKPSYGFSVK